MSQANESRPGGGPGAAESVVATHPQDTGRPRGPHLTAAELEAARPLHVLIVKTGTTKARRRVFLTFAAAEQAYRRARDRGQTATLELHTLVPTQTEGVDRDA